MSHIDRIIPNPSYFRYPDNVLPEALTEGSDFQQWSYKVNYALNHKVGGDKFTSERAHLHKVGYPFKASQRRSSYDAASVILSNVSRDLLLRRIPGYQARKEWERWVVLEKEPWELWEVLEKISQPFPFLRLPRELRDAIYDEYISSWLEKLDETRFLLPKYNWPGTLHTSQITRNETTPVLYSRHKFRRNLEHDVGSNHWKQSLPYCWRRHRSHGPEQLRGVEAPIHILLGDWTKALFRYEDQRRYLRKFTVSLDISKAPSRTTVYIEFQVHVKKAPQLLDVMTRVNDYPNRSYLVVRPQVERRIQMHVEDCNALAERNDWRGEVVFHALESNPKLWMLELGDLEDAPWKLR